MRQSAEVSAVIKGSALALQILFLACAYMPGVQQPASGALLLISLWFWGFGIGARRCVKRVVP